MKIGARGFCLNACIVPALALAILAAFFLAKAFVQGIHVADDAYFASIAKNIAFGLGYGTTVGGRGFTPFDPLIGTGPVVILPAALAISTFGNQHWVPGVTAICIWVFLMVLIFVTLRRADVVLSGERWRDAALVFLSGILLLFPLHSEIWAAFLGEAPAALLLLLAFALVAARNLTLYRVGLASLCCSLAALTKLLAVPGYAVVVSLVLTRLVFIERRPLREVALWILFSASVFAAPLVVFESFKLFGLGDLNAYLQLVRHKMAFIFSRGLEDDPGSNLLSEVLQRDATLRARFGVSVLVVFVTAAVSVWIAIRSRQAVLIWLAAQLGAIVLLLGAYFVFFSNGWPRYFAICLILWAALLAVGCAALNPPKRFICGLAVVALLLVANHRKMPQLLTGFENGLFSRSDELQSALAVTALVDSIAAQNPRRTQLATPWWAATADIEYYSAGADVFRHHSLVESDQPFLLIYRKAYLADRFRAAREVGFIEFKRFCGPAEYESAWHLVTSSLADKH